MRRIHNTSAAILLGSTVMIATLAGQQTPVPSPPQPDRRQIVQAMREGGLRAAAALTGNYVGTEMSDSEGVAPDLGEIARESSLVIIGVPVTSASRLSADGMQISTEYRVRIERVFKGVSVPGALINISAPGGKVWFENGTSAEIKIYGFRTIQSNQRYVFFLWSPQPSQQRAVPELTYYLRFGAQGVFGMPGPQLNGPSYVQPLATRSIDIVAARYARSGQETFLKDVETATRRYPH